jgi:hypothetical protein
MKEKERRISFSLLRKGIIGITGREPYVVDKGGELNRG